MITGDDTLIFDLDGTVRAYLEDGGSCPAIPGARESIARLVNGGTAWVSPRAAARQMRSVAR